MDANTFRNIQPSFRAFKSSASEACGSDWGRIKSCAPRSGETMFVDSRKPISRSQDNSAFGGAALTKSMESRPPSRWMDEGERDIAKPPECREKRRRARDRITS